MTNIEIEDVLSSIRRLVSDEEQRPAARRQTPLILTPNFRVGPGAPGRNVRGDVSRQPSGPVRSSPADRFAAALGGREAESDAAAAASLRFTARPRSAMPAEPAHPSAEATSLEDRIAELEAAIARSDEEFEPDGSEEPVEPMPHALFRDVPRTAAAPVAEPAATAQPAPAPADPWEVTDRPRARLRPTPVDVPEAEPASEAEAEDWDEDEDEIEPVAQDEDARTAALAAEMTAAIAAGAAPAEEPPAARRRDQTAEPRSDARGARTEDEDDIEEALIDEDSLREIVAELVREELRGELGERITRNVRRLIRREIHRALALQDFTDED